MRQPQAESTAGENAAKKPSKDKKQLVILGVLSVVLVVVLSSQFSGDDGDAAQAASADSAAAATGAAPVGDLSEIVETDVPDNEVLSRGDGEDGIKRSPFESFWNSAAPVEKTIEELPPPSITVNGTMTSGRRPIAVIDGQTRYLGDMISGWRLVGIDSRRVSLESPTKSVVHVEMPLLRLPTVRRP